MKLTNTELMVLEWYYFLGKTLEQKRKLINRLMGYRLLNKQVR